VNVSEHFEAGRIGHGLGRIYHVDSLRLRLVHALDEQGHRPICPITIHPITKNAALIQDGGVYQMGAITEWFGHAHISPLTGLPLPHLNILRLSSLADVLESFLRTCRERRDQARGRHVSECQELRVALRSTGSCQELQDALQRGLYCRGQT
jgi:hypothetical protein